MTIRIAVQPNPVRFKYVNWKGILHTYLVKPEIIEYGEYTEQGKSFDGERNWVLHGTMIERDGASRDVGRRTFVLSKMEACND
jgi:hypothetical protein